MTKELVEELARAISKRTYATTVGHSDCLEWEDMRETDRATYRRAAMECLPILARQRAEGRNEGTEAAADAIRWRVEEASNLFHDSQRWHEENAPDRDGTLFEWIFDVDLKEPE